MVGMKGRPAEHLEIPETPDHMPCPTGTEGHSAHQTHCSCAAQIGAFVPLMFRPGESSGT